MAEKLGPPDPFNTMLELTRSLTEAFMLQAQFQTLVNAVPKGDGHPVLVLPGLATSDSTTVALRKFLQAADYQVHKWEGGVNHGPSDKTLGHIKSRLSDVFEQNNGRKVTLIGHSLGGIFARELAREMPHMVNQVITLGTPVCGADHPDSTAPGLRQMFEMLNGKANRFEQDQALVALMKTLPPVPVTAIYSRKDGIVNWQTCLNPKRIRAENVEVGSSHLGLISHPQSMIVIADRLSRPVRNWVPFESRHYQDVNPAFPKTGIQDNLPELRVANGTRQPSTALAGGGRFFP